jgi:hypothetical protein
MPAKNQWNDSDNATQSAAHFQEKSIDEPTLVRENMLICPFRALDQRPISMECQQVDILPFNEEVAIRVAPALHSTVFNDLISVILNR